MLTALSLRITEDADARTSCSLLDRVGIPGKGNTSLVQTSAKRASSRALSARDGISTGIRLLVVKRDCDLLIREPWLGVEVSFTALVFFKMTWHKGVLGPTVVARCIDILLPMAPVALVSQHVHQRCDRWAATWSPKNSAQGVSIQ